MKEDLTIIRGSGNVFADLSLDDAEEFQLKSRCVIIIATMIKRAGLTQTAAARRLGIAQPDLSKMLRGHMRGYSLERLLNFVRALGNDIEINVKPTAANQEGRTSLKINSNDLVLA
jgi:predicted XRE-type DNA-binding protein